MSTEGVLRQARTEARAVLNEVLKRDPANAAAADLLKQIEGR